MIQRFRPALTLTLLLFGLLTGCNSVTVFQSGFNSNSVGTPPAHNQTVGTMDVVSGAPGSVVVVSAPPGATENWVQIQRTGQNAPISVMQCNFSQFQPTGSYTLTAELFIPSGSGLATVEFDTSPFGAPPSIGFLHLDFGDFTVPDGRGGQVQRPNSVRINDMNDSAHVFGSFQRGQFFNFTANLQITSTGATATFNLFGTGASGVYPDPAASPFTPFSIVSNTSPLSLIQQFGAVRFWMGFPWNGSFDTTDIIVNRKK